MTNPNTTFIPPIINFAGGNRRNIYASRWRFTAKKIVINTAFPDYSTNTALRFQTHVAAEEWQGWKTVNQNRQA
ncbi:hypothetical protein [Snodgrassella alvi]|uniref:hypothetical protein n=1 Tax=Snodgrassella alvi TaxID=1196083 RepID=UPI000C1E580D|nr:hypothetical protein [Snodgrassella alvi]PIT40250.1 hypothetical protein BHC53_08315 [Snodgrassella alvi]